MANQLFLAIGVKQFGFPATWQKSRRAMDDFISHSLGLTKKQITMVEGSGLSKKNLITPEAMLIELRDAGERVVPCVAVVADVIAMALQQPPRGHVGALGCLE